MKRYGKIIKYIFSLILIVTIMGDSFAIYAKESSGAAGIADVLQKADDISVRTRILHTAPLDPILDPRGAYSFLLRCQKWKQRRSHS